MRSMTSLMLFLGYLYHFTFMYSVSVVVCSEVNVCGRKMLPCVGGWSPLPYSESRGKGESAGEGASCAARAFKAL